MTRGAGRASPAASRLGALATPPDDLSFCRQLSTVLYVDDEAMIGKAVARWFARRGHDVHLAESVVAAQQSIVDHEPDVLFIDVWLGSESGFELMSWIREERPELMGRVVFVTGEMAVTAQGEKAWRTPRPPVIQKPFDFAEMERYVSEAAQDT